MRRDADDATRGGLSDQGKRVAVEVRRRSLRLYLLPGILIPVGLLVSVNTVSLYNQALNCARQHPSALTLGDSGPGVDAELAQRLHQPFSAGHVAHGSGLGLAICKEIVQVLGGTITLTNRVQHGVVTGLDATVRLPLVA